MQGYQYAARLPVDAVTQRTGEGRVEGGVTVRSDQPNSAYQLVCGPRYLSQALGAVTEALRASDVRSSSALSRIWRVAWYPIRLSLPPDTPLTAHSIRTPVYIAKRQGSACASMRSRSAPPENSLFHSGRIMIIESNAAGFISTSVWTRPITARCLLKPWLRGEQFLLEKKYQALSPVIKKVPCKTRDDGRQGHHPHWDDHSKDQKANNKDARIPERQSPERNLPRCLRES